MAGAGEVAALAATTRRPSALWLLLLSIALSTSIAAAVTELATSFEPGDAPDQNGW